MEKTSSDVGIGIVVDSRNRRLQINRPYIDQEESTRSVHTYNPYIPYVQGLYSAPDSRYIKCNTVQGQLNQYSRPACSVHHSRELKPKFDSR